MKRVRVLLTAVVLILASGAAHGDQAASQAWFSALSASDRTNLQRSLILTDDYDALVDGQFGLSTFNALIAFQYENGFKETGVLTPDENEALVKNASTAFQSLGFDLVKDTTADIALAVPLTLLPRRQVGAMGTSYFSADHAVTLTTEKVLGGSAGYVNLYQTLRQRAWDVQITYETINGSFFAVSGKVGAHTWYSMFQYDGAETVGYTVTWTHDYDAQGSVVAVLAASYSTPLDRLPAQPPPATRPTTDPPGSTRFGSFLVLQSVPQAILLDGDITNTTESDFDAALKATAGASLVVLNSNGGSVAQALAVAEEIHARGMDTTVLKDFGCYSACAYLYFAGVNRQDAGNLGVHQIYGDGVDASGAQTTLSVILAELNSFGVSEGVISAMLATPPSSIHVFGPDEIASLGINRGRPVVPDPTRTGDGIMATGASEIAPTDLGL